MNSIKFDEIIEERILKIRRTLQEKSQEYAREDRLHNFKRAGEMLRCTPERALLGMLAKHLISVNDMVDDLEKGTRNTWETWDEKIGDAINYLCLLEALTRRNEGERIYSPFQVSGKVE